MTKNQSIYCKIINHLHGIESKVMEMEETESLQRRFDRMHSCFEELELHIHNPLNEQYDETRIDCEATIIGDSVDNLHVVEVIKPIIYNRIEGQNHILQRAVVIVESM